MNDTNYESLKQSSPRQVFRPRRNPTKATPPCTLAARRHPEPAFQTIRKTVHELDPNVPVTDLKTLIVNYTNRSTPNT